MNQKCDSLSCGLNKNGSCISESMWCAIPLGEAPEVKFSFDLGMAYQFDGKRLTFEDGVSYSIREAVSLSRAAHDVIKAVHLVKKMFKGEILFPGQDDYAWPEDPPAHIIPKTFRKKVKPKPASMQLDLFDTI